MFWIDIVSRIVHVSTAIVLVGGSVFTLLVLSPALGTLSDDVRRSFSEAISGRWKRFIHIGILLFLVTGFYNYIQAIPNHKGDGLYHALLGIKMLSAFVIFFIASALVGRSAGMERMRTNRVFWLKLLVLLAAVIVAISGFVKVRGPANSVPVVPAIAADPAT
ncbi:MAG: hypothetical protein R3C53_27125 [Pirellulaceae bacterium]